MQASSPSPPPSEATSQGAGAEPGLQPGDRVGDYEVVARIGAGGFGEVYAAQHALIGKKAAVKILRAEHARSKQVTQRFLAEARAVNQIQHRGIVDIFAFDTLPDGRQYFAMELLEGEPLDVFARKNGGLAVEVVFAILRRVARALDAAHAAGIAHRDLKPENIFITTDETGRLEPKLLDFGIAKLMTEGGARQTQTGQMLGTPLYMSPEQWRGRKVDHRTDIYALGVVAYELLTGSYPFSGETPGDVMINVCTGDPIPATTTSPDLPAGVDAVLGTLLAKDPAARPPSASAAVRLLQEVVLGEVDELNQTHDEAVERAPTVLSDPGADTEQTGADTLVAESAIPATLPAGQLDVPSPILKSTTEPVSSSPSSSAPSSVAAAPSRTGGRLVAAAAALVVMGGLAVWRLSGPAESAGPEESAAVEGEPVESPAATEKSAAISRSARTSSASASASATTA
ncbi:MAG: serine/threonine protein kinase, partial [Myxococcales bacterium]|nr:serine/threonine protein kinase [Myxococcales bacterium]